MKIVKKMILSIIVLNVFMAAINFNNSLVYAGFIGDLQKQAKAFISKRKWK